MTEYLKKSDEYVGAKESLTPGLNFCKVGTLYLSESGASLQMTSSSSALTYNVSINFRLSLTETSAEGLRA